MIVHRIKQTRVVREVNLLVHFEDDEVVWPAVSHGGPLPAGVLGVPPPHRYQVVLGVADKVPLHQPRGHAFHVQVGHLGLIAWAQINIRSISQLGEGRGVRG